MTFLDKVKKRMPKHSYNSSTSSSKSSFICSYNSSVVIGFITGCSTDEDMVNITALRLKGEAGQWWEAARHTWEANPTWDAFKDTITNHYIVPSL